ncbi:MAG: MBL fold metallo-hydrolase [Deltaproteobacteria bacterium]|nr:MBL fold metallo-hydrolase [Deltaproteobacteria bacterium]
MFVTASAIALLVACGAEEKPPAPASESASESSEPDANGFTAPTAETAQSNAKFGEGLLDYAEQTDFDEAKQGLIASDPTVRITLADGEVWSPELFSFVQGEAPASVNPSLWRQAKLNGNHGLFQVAEGIYQVRGYDVSNMTWIRGKTGWIIVDPLTSVQSATAAVGLARKHLGNDPVTAVIFTHSHIDHFAGVSAVLPEDPIPVVAPAHFVEEVTSENIFAGTAMSRRATYQFGAGLPYGPRSYVDTGLGKQPAAADIAFALPTDYVDRTPQEMELDGVRFTFQHVPNSEAPAELAFYLPDHKAYCGAEIVNRTMHNLYTLRGAKVRDAYKWSDYIDDAVRLFGGDMQIVFMSHTWPAFGHDRAIAFLKGQRDTYRFIHDQTLRLANQGFTPREISEQLELPPGLAKNFSNRGYYGTLRHNAKAVYQFYFGWYDGNPANLNPWPPVELGKRYVEALGGAAAVKQKAQAAFDAGDYRWAATLLDHLVFADETDTEARALLARTYDQLGYQAESGVWRAVYLSGANELRHGVVPSGFDAARATAILDQVPLHLFFSAMATRVNAAEAADQEPVTLNFVFTDVNETHVLELSNGVLLHRRAEADPNAAATVNLTRDLFLRLGTGKAGIRDLIFSGDFDVDGSRMAVLSFFSLMEPLNPDFPIVTP